MQRNKLCSFTNLISQKFSDTAVILAIAYPSVALKTCQLWTPKARVLEFFLITIWPFEKIFKEYFFSEIVGFGVPFSINFLSSSAFLSFRKALKQYFMSPSVSVVRRNHVRDLIFLQSGSPWIRYKNLLKVPETSSSDKNWSTSHKKK